MSSVSFLEVANISLVSLINDSGVAVKLGGAWGGFLNLDEVILLVVTGLREPVEDAVGLKGRIWFKMEPSRGGARKGARASRVTTVKRTPERRERRSFERASVTDE